MGDISSSSSTNRESARKRSSHYPLYVFFILFAINLLNSMDRYVLTGAADVIGKELHLGIDQIGYLSSAFIVFLTISILPFGYLSDRIKRKDVIAGALAVWSVATAFTALAGNFLTLFLTRSVLGIGEAGYSPPSQALISDYFKQSQRATVMSWWAASGNVGLMLGVVLGGVVAGWYYGAWRIAFLFAGIPGLILAFIAWKMREPRRNQADEEAGTALALPVTEVDAVPATADLPRSPLSQFLLLLRIKTLVVIILMYTFTFFVISGTVTYLSIFLQQRDTFGLTSGQAGLFSGFGIVIAGTVGVLLGGYVANWLLRYYAGAHLLVSGLAFFLSAFTYAASVLTAVFLHNLGLFTIFFVLSTILINVNSGPSAAATQDIAPAALRGLAVAISLFIAHILGDSFAPALIGYLARSFDPTGLHFQQNLAGHDLMLSLIYTYPPALAIAGLISMIGSRWTKGDMETARHLDQVSSVL
jgi:MFS family permease